MAESTQPKVARTTRTGMASTFSEIPLWESVGQGWERLHGSFREVGYSVEWHDFENSSTIEWGKSFHPDSVELCFNLDGRGQVQADSSSTEFVPQTVGFYSQRDSGLTASRGKGQRHQFLTVEFSLPFLERHLDLNEPTLHPGLRRIFQRRRPPVVSEPSRLTPQSQQIISSLRTPPVLAGARRLWYHAKVLELASTVFFQAPPDEELFCERQKRMNHERVQKVVAILNEDLTDAPSLEEIGKRVGCSQFHLSRIFSAEMGMTIPQFLRQVRMEKAAELLRAGTHNVTEAALDVGYSSLSHFSTAFHQTFGCCPGLYPIAPHRGTIRRLQG